MREPDEGIRRKTEEVKSHVPFDLFFLFPNLQGIIKTAKPIRLAIEQKLGLLPERLDYLYGLAEEAHKNGGLKLPSNLTLDEKFLIAARFWEYLSKNSISQIQEIFRERIAAEKLLTAEKPDGHGKI